MKSQPIRLAVTVSAILCLASAGALAQGTAQQRSDCMGDAFKFCSAYIPNVQQIEACLRRNVNSLTPSCRLEFQPDGKTKLQSGHFKQ